jgi:hypothetical protein
MVGLEEHEWRLVLWSIHVCYGLRNGPYCLGRYLSVCKFCFPPFKCLFRLMFLIVFRPNLLPFYILDFWLPATIFSSVSYTLRVDQDQVDRCFILIKWSYTSTADLPKK